MTQLTKEKYTLKDVFDLEPVKLHRLGCEKPEEEYRMQIVWSMVTLMLVLHTFALYGLYLCFVSAKWQTSLSAFFLYQMSGLGVTAGAHRLWSHHAYKARLPVQIFLAFCQTMASQNHIYDWVQDHRVHHKYVETDAYPHNSNRGFFFAHIGWLLVNKHPALIAKLSKVRLDDLELDPVVQFQRKYYIPLVLLCSLVLPTYVPHLLWNETLYNSLFICGFFRCVFTLQMTWCVNSAAHMWGRHPYDKSYSPAENYFTVFGAIGEGFHNYHHVFPWDYAASELGWRYNLSTIFINAMAAIGQTYDLKRVSPEMIRKRKARTGDVHEHGNYGLYHPGEAKLNNNDTKEENKFLIQTANTLKSKS